MADIFCSVLSQQLDEPLAGTAGRGDIWLLLEYNDSWAAKATHENNLPRPVKAHLDAFLTATPHSRLQFIRQNRRPGDLAFFMATMMGGHSVLYRFELSDYETLLDLDLAAIAAGRYGQAKTDQSLLLVCTNGKRDRCCALYGLALYQALTEIGGAAVWQTTHLGGHRFAPTLVSLPDGYVYGRVAPAGADQLWAAHQGHDLLLDHLRGRACYDGPTQAAEILLRQHTGRVALDAFRWLATEKGENGQWLVRFVDPAGQIHPIHLYQEALSTPVQASCGKSQTETPIRYWLNPAD